MLKTLILGRSVTGAAGRQSIMVGTMRGKWFQLISSLALASVVSLFFYVIGAVFNHTFQYYFLIWNLFLAWLPLIFVMLLIRTLKDRRWSSWPAISLTFLWLVFLPNSFYILSDFVHLLDGGSMNLVFTIVMLASFAFSGCLVGFTSLRLVHHQLVTRGHRPITAWSLVGVILLASSWAIYIGRYVRLNSWDILTNLPTLLYSVSDQIIHPASYFLSAGISGAFFILLGTIYLVIWRLGKIVDIIR